MNTRARRYGLAAAVVWLYLYSFPYFPGIHSANELPRVYLTWAMVEEGTFAIDTGVARWGSTADVSPAHGHVYSNKAPGSSFLAVPAYLLLKAGKAMAGAEPTLAEMMWTCRVATGVLPTLLLLWLLARFWRRFADDDGRRLAILGYALGSMALTYSVLFIAHQLSAVCMGIAYMASVDLVEGRAGEPRSLPLAPGMTPWIAGLAAGCALLVDYQSVFAGLPVAVYLLWHLVRDRRYATLARTVAGALPPVALLLFYHQQAFGSPFKTGYDFSQTFAHYHQQGFLGMTELRWEAFVGSTVAPDNGLVFLCPMLLLALPGWVILARRRLWWHLGITAAVAVIYLLFISSINFWRGGWQMGPRYITVMLPFVMVPVAAALDAACRCHGLLRAAAAALVLVGVVVYALSCAVFPHFPEVFANPLYEVTFRLIRANLAPYNLGWVVGLRGAISLVPYCGVLIAAVLLVLVPTQKQWGSALLGLGGAALIVSLYALAPGGGPAADRAYNWVRSVFPSAVSTSAAPMSAAPKRAASKTALAAPQRRPHGNDGAPIAIKSACTTRASTPAHQAVESPHRGSNRRTEM